MCQTHPLTLGMAITTLPAGTYPAPIRSVEFKICLATGWVGIGAGLGAGRAGFGFKVNPPYPTCTPYIYKIIFLNISITLGLYFIGSKDIYKNFLMFNFSYRANL